MSDEKGKDQPSPNLLQPQPPAGDPPRPRSPQGDAGRGEGGEESARRRGPEGPATVRNVASRDKVLFAREQRQLATRLEARLWALLRDHRFGFKFRRQHPLGDFVLDFYCPEALLCLEIDGPTHAEQRRYDAWRDEELERRGILTIRLRAEELAADLPSAVESLRQACTTRAIPHP